jgi:hypothetical protein
VVGGFYTFRSDRRMIFNGDLNPRHGFHECDLVSFHLTLSSLERNLIIRSMRIRKQPNGITWNYDICKKNIS